MNKRVTKIYRTILQEVWCNVADDICRSDLNESIYKKIDVDLADNARHDMDHIAREYDLDIIKDISKHI